MTKSRNLIMPRKQWREDELALLRDRYANASASELAALFGCELHVVYKKAWKLGLTKSEDFFKSAASGRMQTGSTLGIRTRFVRGQVSHNAGKKGLDMGGRSHETRFKKGQRPTNWLPVGAHRVNSLGYLDRKIQEGRGHLNWERVHRLVWLEANGSIPPGYVVRFKDGRKTTKLSEITLDALELVSEAEHGRRNIFHNRYPQEIGELIMLKAQINRQIRRREREEQD